MKRDLESMAHPIRLSFERCPDGRDVIVGQLRFLAWAQLWDFEPGRRVAADDPAPDRFVTEHGERAKLKPGRVVVGFARAPRHVLNTEPIRQILWCWCSGLLQIFAKPRPALLCALKRARAAHVPALEIRRHPRGPGISLRTSAVLVEAVLISDRQRAPGVYRRPVLERPQAFAAPLPSLGFEPELPKRAFAVVKEAGHLRSPTHSDKQFKQN